jgi:hypothetical protein
LSRSVGCGDIKKRFFLALLCGRTFSRKKTGVDVSLLRLANPLVSRLAGGKNKSADIPVSVDFQKANILRI